MLQAEAEFERKLDWEKTRGGPPVGFPAMPEIPGGRYTRDDFFRLEMEHVWRKSWILAGSTKGLESSGSYRVFDKLGIPLLIVRGNDGRLRCFYNTCRHRGAPVVREACGRANVLRCQYHSWAYALDGRLIAVTEERDFIGLDKSKRGLLEIQCDTWGPLVFINENPGAAPLLEYLGPLAQEMSWMPRANLREVCKQNYLIDCNWKATMDAFMEAYHIDFIHSSTGGVVFDNNAALMGLLEHGHSRMTIRRTTEGITRMTRPSVPDIATIPDMYRRNVITYTIFPNITLLAEPFGFSMQLIWPRGVRGTELEAMYLGPDWGEGDPPRFWQSFVPIIDNVLKEDQVNLAPIQSSLDSGAFTGVMLNYQERRIYWLNEELDRRIGTDRVPAGLAVEQMLGSQMEPALQVDAA